MIRPTLEQLEGREVPAVTVFQQGGLLSVIGDNAANQVALTPNNDGTVNVRADGVSQNFAGVTQFFFDGRAGDDDFVSRLDVNGTALGGQGNDSLQSFNRNASVTLDGGQGQDDVYMITPAVSGSVASGGQGRDRVTVNANVGNVRDAADEVPVVFGQATQPGFSLIGGVLYYVPRPGGNSVLLVESKGMILALSSVDGIAQPVQSFARADVDAVATVLGAGDDRFVNRVSGLRVVAYGAAGDDVLDAGPARSALLKGGGGDDTLLAAGVRQDADLSGDPGVDVLSGPAGRTVFRTDAADLFRAAKGDRVVPQ